MRDFPRRLLAMALVIIILVLSSLEVFTSRAYFNSNKLDQDIGDMPDEASFIKEEPGYPSLDDPIREEPVIEEAVIEEPKVQLENPELDDLLEDKPVYMSFYQEIQVEILGRKFSNKDQIWLRGIIPSNLEFVAYPLRTQDFSSFAYEIRALDENSMQVDFVSDEPFVVSFYTGDLGSNDIRVKKAAYRGYKDLRFNISRNTIEVQDQSLGAYYIEDKEDLKDIAKDKDKNIKFQDQGRLAEDFSDIGDQVRDFDSSDEVGILDQDIGDSLDKVLDQDLYDQKPLVEYQEPIIDNQVIRAEVYKVADDLGEDLPSKISLKGPMPLGSRVFAYPVDLGPGNDDLVFAYDIKIFDPNGGVYQPLDYGHSIEIQISNPILEEFQADDLQVFHKKDLNSQADQIMIGSKDGASLSFKVEDFSIFYLVRNLGILGQTRQSQGPINNPYPYHISGIAYNNADQGLKYANIVFDSYDEQNQTLIFTISKYLVGGTWRERIIKNENNKDGGKLYINFANDSLSGKISQVQIDGVDLDPVQDPSGKVPTWSQPILRGNLAMNLLDRNKQTNHKLSVKLNSPLDFNTDIDGLVSMDWLNFDGHRDPYGNTSTSIRPKHSSTNTEDVPWWVEQPIAGMIIPKLDGGQKSIRISHAFTPRGFDNGRRNTTMDIEPNTTIYINEKIPPELVKFIKSAQVYRSTFDGEAWGNVQAYDMDIQADGTITTKSNPKIGKTSNLNDSRLRLLDNSPRGPFYRTGQFSIEYTSELVLKDNVDPYDFLDLLVKKVEEDPRSIHSYMEIDRNTSTHPKEILGSRHYPLLNPNLLNDIMKNRPKNIPAPIFSKIYEGDRQLKFTLDRQDEIDKIVLEIPIMGTHIPLNLEKDPGGQWVAGAGAGGFIIQSQGNEITIGLPATINLKVGDFVNGQAFAGYIGSTKSSQIVSPRIGDIVINDGTNPRPANYVQVDFNPGQGGTLQSGDDFSFYVNPDATVTLTPPRIDEKSGYIFDGWDKPYTQVQFQTDTTITATYTIAVPTGIDDNTRPTLVAMVSALALGIGILAKDYWKRKMRQ